MSLYGSVLWNFQHKLNNLLFTEWRKDIRRLWRVPRQTHNILLPILVLFSATKTETKTFVNEKNRLFVNEN